MKIFKKLGIGLLFVFLLVVVGGFLLPQKTTVERSANINANSATVFTYVNSLKKFHDWSPWVEMDPQMQVEYSGAESGVSSSIKWASQNAHVGNGAQTIVESEEYKRVITDLFFDGQKGGQAEFELNSLSTGTQLIWRFHADFGVNPLARYFGLMLDKMLGGVFEAGLSRLQSLVEKLPATVTQEFIYDLEGTKLSGFLAYPKSAQKAPGILVVHEWWGHTDYARKRAKMLADLGYVAFALDMYGDGKVANHPKEANAFMMEVMGNAELARARFEKALNILKNQPMVDAENIASVGYCMGGSLSLNMGRSGLPLKAVVSFHGGLAGLAPVAEGSVHSKFLVLNGAEDPFVTAEAKATFKQEMDAAKTNYEFIEYPGAMHGFTNPGADEKGTAYGLPLKYNAEADQASWKRMQDFLTEVLVK
jgi:dienelactone hydrolase